MRKFSYVEPTSASDSTPIETIVTEDEIRLRYYPWWKKQMVKVGKEGLISWETCLEDWITVNWAEEITDAT